MATLFLASGELVWTAKFRAWCATKQAFVWRSKSTGVRDKTAAAGIAANYEMLSERAKESALTRDKVMKVVNDILVLAGRDAILAVPPLSNLVESLMAGVQGGTLKKYTGYREVLKRWNKAKYEKLVDAWTPADVEAFYQFAQMEVSTATANGYLNFLSMVFGKAIALGYRASNPVKAIARKTDDSVEKEAITRSEMSALLRTIRASKATPSKQAWVALCALGWHTGHRIQDLLDVEADKAVKLDPELGWLVSLQPRKKRSRKGRLVILPLPAWLGKMLTRIENFKSIRGGDNYNGRISNDFVAWLVRAGIDPMPVQRKKRVVNLKSFHSTRHAMSSRLIDTGVSGELARLVTDHDSPQIQRK